jgi:ABC-type multidrug transport system fused ATPase/permease subunit
VVALFLLIAISWQLTLAVLAIMPLYLCVFKYFNPRVQAASDQVGRHISTISGNVHEQISAIALVKIYAAEEREAARFMAHNDRHSSYVRQQSHLGHLMGASAELLIHLGTTVIIGYGCYLALGNHAELTAGDLTRLRGNSIRTVKTFRGFESGLSKQPGIDSARVQRVRYRAENTG